MSTLLTFLAHSPPLLASIPTTGMTSDDVKWILALMFTVGNLGLGVFNARQSRALTKEQKDQSTIEELTKKSSRFEGEVQQLRKDLEKTERGIANTAILESRLGSVEGELRHIKDANATMQRNMDQHFAVIQEYVKKSADTAVEIARMGERDTARKESIDTINDNVNEIKRMVTEYLLAPKANK